VADGQRGACLSRLNNVLMQMRKNCNHPDLITSALDPSPMFPSAEELVAQCGKMQLLHRLLTRLKAGGHKVLIFSQVGPLANLPVLHHALRPPKPRHMASLPMLPSARLLSCSSRMLFMSLQAW
jgi:hypothetical protein